MTLSLEALANWEAAVLARISGAKERRTSETRRLRARVCTPSIPQSSGHTSRSADPSRKRGSRSPSGPSSSIWHSFKALPVDSGISEVAESTVREVFGALDRDDRERQRGRGAAMDARLVSRQLPRAVRYLSGPSETSTRSSATSPHEDALENLAGTAFEGEVSSACTGPHCSGRRISTGSALPKYVTGR